jgi:hypothetical protein
LLNDIQMIEGRSTSKEKKIHIREIKMHFEENEKLLFIYRHDYTMINGEFFFDQISLLFLMLILSTLIFILYIKAKSTSSSSLLMYSTSLLSNDQLPVHLRIVILITLLTIASFVMWGYCCPFIVIWSLHLSLSLLFHEKLFFTFPSALSMILFTYLKI